ncbi:MAG: FlgB family protein [Rhodobacteraceae bacterium]|nr:FlgB family protein [Paracoccaceae bacterium]
MYNGLALFKMASARAAHAATGQGIVAQNIANADTPGYVARRLSPFQASFVEPGAKGGLRTARSSHLANRDETPNGGAKVRLDRSDMAPNGNSVSVETEMMQAALIKQDHELALAAYRGGINLLRTVLGRSS